MVEHLGLMKSLVQLTEDKIARLLELPDFHFRREEICLNHEMMRYGRVFMVTESSGAYSEVGWVVNSSLPMCMICAVKFSLWNRRHHCRGCGNLVCDKCSPYVADVCVLDLSMKHRVCLLCVKHYMGGNDVDGANVVPVRAKLDNIEEVVTDDSSQSKPLHLVEIKLSDSEYSELCQPVHITPVDQAPGKESIADATKVLAERMAKESADLRGLLDAIEKEKVRVKEAAETREEMKAFLLQDTESDAEYFEDNEYIISYGAALAENSMTKFNAEAHRVEEDRRLAEISAAVTKRRQLAEGKKR